MEFVKRMVVLSGQGKGVLKLEKIGGKVGGQLTVYPEGRNTAENVFKNGVLYIKNGEYILPPVTCGEGGYFSLKSNALKAGEQVLNERIECVFALEGKVVLCGCNQGAANSAKLFAAALAKYPNKQIANMKLEKAENEVPQNDDAKKTQNSTQDTDAKQSESTNEQLDNKAEITAENTSKSKQNDAENIKKTAKISDNAGGFDSKNSQLKANDIFKNGTVLVNDIVKYSTEYPFYEAVRLQLEELFNTYPNEEKLENAIPQSKWAHIDYDKEEYYVVGVINQEQAPKYICYGVPADKTVMPVCDINENCEWVALDEETPNLGYYMMYQDAISGETILKV